MLTKILYITQVQFFQVIFNLKKTQYFCIFQHFALQALKTKIVLSRNDNNLILPRFFFLQKWKA